jgi:hypothetical protein
MNRTIRLKTVLPFGQDNLPDVKQYNGRIRHIVFNRNGTNWGSDQGLDLY